MLVGAESLIENIQAGKIHVVVTRDVAMIARDWQQFFEFMEACDKAGTDVVSIDKEQDAWNQCIRVRELVKEYFGRETVL